MLALFMAGIETTMIIIVAVLAVIVLLFLVTCYVKCPPNWAYVISGLSKKPRILSGKGGFRVPLLERIDRIYLGVLQIDIKTPDVPTIEFINIFVDAVANVKVKADQIREAAQNFVGRTEKDVVGIVQQILEGNMREIVGQMRLTELVQNRYLFAEKVRDNAVSDVEKLGMEIVNLNVQNFSDKNNVINDLGIDNVSQIRKNAAIAKAVAEKEVSIASDSAREEANRIKVEKDVQISKQRSALANEQSALKIIEDSRRAEADAAYTIKKQEQEKIIGITTTDAVIARRQKELELQEKEITMAEKKLDATVRKDADARKYQEETLANAALYRRQKEAEAKKYEMIQNAEAIKKTQELESEAIKVKAEAEKVAKEMQAQGIRAIGEAEADAIEKKAEAMKKMGEQSILEMYLNVLPEVVGNAASPLAQTEKIVMYGDGNSQKLIKDVMNTSSQILEALQETTGLDVRKLIAKTIGKDDQKTITEGK